MISSSMCAHRWVGLFLLLTAIASLGHSLTHKGFMMEDREVFSRPTTRSLRFIPYHFFNGIKVGARYQTYYRPLQYVFITLTNVAFGQNYPLYYGLNILLLWACAFLLYLLIHEFFGQILAVSAAILFVAHPFNMSIVNFISSGSYLFCAAMMLSAMIVLSRHSKRGSLRWTVVRVVISNILFIGAMACHEFGIMLPFYVAIILYCGGGSFRRKSLYVGSMLAVAVVYLIFRFTFTTLHHDLFPHEFSRFINLEQYMASLGQGLSWYLWRLVSPSGIVGVWAVKLHGGLLWALVPVVVAAVFSTLLIFFYRCGRRDLFVGLSWITIALTPAFLGICFLRQGYVCFEPHWMIFALMGFCLMISAIILRLGNAGLSLAVVVLLAGLWISADRIYTYLWSDEKLYCHYWFNQCPDFTSPLQFLSRAYAESGDTDMALYYLEKTSVMYRKPFGDSHEVGLLILKQGRFRQAKQYFEKYLALDPNSAFVLTNLGVIAMAENDEAKARSFFERAIKQERFEVASRLNLALICKKNNDLAGSVRLFSEILSFDPGHEVALVELIQIYMQQQDRPNTLRTAKALLKYSHNPDVLKNAASILEKHRH